ncbi:murein hydrolase activator EnvC family protein [Desulfuromonas thiophila]|uniref:murein hydrolase activator EnvC family protein n=1 Tax=Desulfuromonas thiophila TaxID=57664 RepID=UPI0024A86B58|nr:peptidoglycan DD-metalloendopeptidase family protein [Desulfuromonas thiophila]
MIRLSSGGHWRPFLCQLLLLALLLVPSLRPPLAADELASKQKQLKQMQQQISATSGQLAQKTRAEHSTLQQLEQLQNRVTGSQRQLDAASTELAQLRQQVSEAQLQIDQYEQVLQQARGAVVKRLRALYTSDDSSSLCLLFSTESPLTLAENADFLRRITAHDQALLHSYRDQLQQSRQVRQTLQQQLERQQQLLDQQQRQRQQLLADQKEKEQLIRQIRNDKASLAGVLAELEERSRSLANLVDTLKQRQRDSYQPRGQRFAQARSQLPWPSTGKVRQEFGTFTQQGLGTGVKSNGLEIAALPGSPIKAVWPGQVVFAGPFKGYGELLIVDHGDQYYSLYAQTRNLRVGKGDRVDSGTVLALSGYDQRDSYHFEIRHRGTPVNPRQWLKPR